MKYLFSRWEDVRRTLDHSENVLWLFDFDGTLAPIVGHPKKAVLSPKMRGLLKKLAERHPGRVGLLSGRRLNQIRSKVGIPDLIYGGTHGFEIRGPKFHWNHPLSSARQRQIEWFAGQIRRRLSTIDGAWLEDKRCTLCIHYREVKPKDAERTEVILGELCNQARALGFRLQKGLKAVEFLSDARWDKGQAVKWLKKRLRAAGVFYAGDDTTDETVFQILGRRDVGVRMGSAPNSHARYYVNRQKESPKLLERLLTL